jgi:DNA polymerase-4
MPLELMENVLGQNGGAIWRKAQGVDQSPVVQYNERKSISTEQTFDRDTTDNTRLRSIISSMAESVIFQLRQQQKVCACVTVKIRYSDFQTKSIQRRISYTAADHDILPVVMELFDRLFNRRLLVRLVGVRLSELVNGHHQMRLFSENERYAGLYRAMDRIRLRYGDQAVMRAIGMEGLYRGRHNLFRAEPLPGENNHA